MYLFFYEQKTIISSLHLYRTFLENNIRYGM